MSGDARVWPPSFVAPLFSITMNQRELLALAWLAEMAADGCAMRGQVQWAGQLLIEASNLRGAAVDQ